MTDSVDFATSFKEVTQLAIEGVSMTNELLKERLSLNSDDAAAILKNYILPIAEASTVAKAALSIVDGIVARVHAVKILKNQCNYIVMIFDASKPVLENVTEAVTNHLSNNVHDLHSVLRKESLNGVKWCMNDILEKMKACQQFVEKWEGQDARRFGVAFVRWFQSVSKRNELSELLNSYNDSYKRLSEQLVALGFAVQLRAHEWREEFEELYTADMDELKGSIQQLGKDNAVIKEVLTIGFNQMRNDMLHYANVIENAVLVGRSEKNVQNFTKAYLEFQKVAHPLFDTLFGNVWHEGVNFPFQIALSVDRVYNENNIELKRKIRQVRLAGRSLVALLGDNFCMSIMDYMNRQGFSEATNVVKVTAAADAVNWKVMNIDDFGNWELKSYTHVLALNAMALDVNLFSVLRYWNPKTSKNDDPFPTDFMCELMADIEGNIDDIIPPNGYSIDLLEDLLENWKSSLQ